MLYVILLLVIVGALVALMLKKRNAEKQTPAKPIAKKSANRTKLVEEPVAVKKTTTPLSADVRQKIESLIQQQNYFAAEAQINQALNRDNTQHELYLLLLEIHMLQKDEFAISQLINHIRSLELDDILSQAEQKKAVYDAENQQPVKDTIEFKLNDTPAAPAKAAVVAPTVEETSAFDTLVSTPDKTAEPVVEEKPLTFDFSEAPIVAATPAPVVEPVQAPQTLEFESFSFDTEKKSVETTTEPLAENIEAPAEAVAPTMDFDTSALALSPTETVAPAQEIEPIKLDFTGFETPVETPAENISPAKNELDFSFTSPEPTVEIQPESVVEVEPTAPSLDFNFSVAETPVAPVVEETPVISTDAPNLDFNLFGAPTEVVQPEPVVETVDHNDPLVKSFPELQDVNEVNLNLDLAAQYIQLGAFEAARELLDERSDAYSAEQNERAQQLRNQLA